LGLGVKKKWIVNVFGIYNNNNNNNNNNKLFVIK